MQPIVISTDCKDLYQLLGAMLEKSALADSGQETFALLQSKSLLIWSPEAESTLLDSFEKVELIERYARKLNHRIVLSAASDSKLMNWGREIGWQVLWQIPAMDQTLQSSSVAA
jgi:hypothetical protein